MVVDLGVKVGLARFCFAFVEIGLGSDQIGSFGMLVAFEEYIVRVVVADECSHFLTDEVLSELQIV